MKYKLLFLIILFSISNGCSGSRVHVEPTDFSNDPVVEETYTYFAPTNPTIDTDIQYPSEADAIDDHPINVEWLDDFNDFWSINLVLSTYDERAINFIDESTEITLCYMRDSRNLNAELYSIFSYEKDTVTKSAIVQTEIGINETSGFDSITGILETNDGQSFPFSFDFFMQRIMDNETGSSTFGNIIKFTPQLYNKLRDQLLYFSKMSSSFHYMMSYYIDTTFDDVNPVNNQDLLNRSIHFDTNDDYFDQIVRSEQRFYISDQSGGGDWIFCSNLSPIEKTLMVASLIHHDVYDFSNVELEQFFVPFASLYREYTCECDKCYFKGNFDGSPDLTSSLGLDGYHSMITKETFEKLYHNVFDITVDVDLQIDQKYLRAPYDPVTNGFYIYNSDGDGVHANHGVYIIDIFEDDSGAFVDYIPLALYDWNNDYFDINGIRVENVDKGKKLFAFSDTFEGYIHDCIDLYPNAFPKFRMEFVCPEGQDICTIVSICELS